MFENAYVKACYERRDMWQGVMPMRVCCMFVERRAAKPHLPPDSATCGMRTTCTQSFEASPVEWERFCCA